jgi:aminopeptidase-like protein
VSAGDEMMGFIAEAFPICRSITGDGVRATLAMIQQRIPLAIEEVATGTPAFDWTVPKEWNVRDAWIKDPSGRKVVDFQESNLHLLNYSVPVHQKLSLADLKPYLFTLPDKPELIPYRTSYYKEAWGFCLRHSTLESLPEGEYEVFVDSTLADGALSYGECYLPGESEREVLLSTHVCHPSLCNDNLSGIAVMTALARELAARPRRRYSYRFLFIPGTIGSITWLARNEERTGKIAHGLVAANLGDGGNFHYKRSRRSSFENNHAEIDRAVVAVLQDSGEPFGFEAFVPFGYDERQFCSPGFDLPVGSLTRTPYGRYPEYHTSADDLSFVTPAALEGSLRTYLAVIDLLEGNRRYVNLNPKCEPQLGRRGLYRAIGGDDAGRSRELALLWVLNLSEGRQDLLAIAERAKLSFTAIRAAADALLEAGLLREVEEGK